MFSRLNRKSFLSYAIVPFVLTGGSSVPPPEFAMPESPQLIAQSNGWITSFWGRRPRKRLGARGGACAVAPGLLAEQKSNDLSTQNKLAVWHERPMFVWDGKATQVQVRDHANREVVLWTQPVGATQQVLYSGDALQPGKFYQWQVLGEEPTGSDRNYWITFALMPTEQHDQIKTQLETLEQQLQSSGSSAEEIALQKASYFADRNLWSDALQVLFAVENPSASFLEERRSYVAQLCPQATETTQAK